MANLFLLNPLPSPRPAFALGIAVLKKVAEQAGHFAQIIQPQWRFPGAVSPTYIAMEIAETLSEHLRRRPPGKDIIGISTLSDNFQAARHIARWAKEGKLGLFTGVEFKPLVLLGGHLPTLMAEQILREEPAFDVVLKGEAEESLPLLLNCIERGETSFSHVPGCVWREGTDVHQGPPCKVPELDSVPFPDFSFLRRSFELYSKLGPMPVPVDAQRGCPGECVFCSIAAFLKEEGIGRKVRYRSVQKVVESFEPWLDEGIDYFFLYSDCVLAEPGFLSELASFLEKENLRVRIDLSARPQDILRAQAELEKAAKSEALVLNRIEIGFEAHSSNALRLLRKGTTPEMNMRVISFIEKLRRETGDPLEIDFDFILLSHPDITLSDLVSNILFLATFMPEDQEFAPAAVPYPKTPLWYELLERGFEPDPDRGYVIPYEFSDPVVQRFFERVARLDRIELLHRLRRLARRQDIAEALARGNW